MLGWRSEGRRVESLVALFFVLFCSQLLILLLSPLWFHSFFSFPSVFELRSFHSLFSLSRSTHLSQHRLLSPQPNLLASPVSLSLLCIPQVHTLSAVFPLSLSLSVSFFSWVHVLVSRFFLGFFSYG
ncbi:hypothetical protein BDY24DRAFT_393840 [Mrakia frigida]|uniref:uncharacterized protein n=1 Tax=Mrakia frigida TaxID=29902 RepID=UPI003FCC2588